MTKRRGAITRNYKNYLLENIQPNDGLIASLLTLSCLSDEQSHFIRRQPLNRVKNTELLFVMRSFDETNYSNFIKCLRKTNQKTLAKTMDNGGGVIRIEVKTRAEKSVEAQEVHVLHEYLKDLRYINEPRSHKTDQLISKLKDEGIKILISQLDRQTLVVWIWCRSQTALRNIHQLYESNKLIDVLFENMSPSISKVINIDCRQFEQTIVVRPISINCTQRINVPGNEACGVTKLRAEIYIVCQSSPSFVIRIFEDRTPYRFLKEIVMEEMQSSWDTRSSENENCLYICDQDEKCVWKIIREADDQHKIIKWLTINYRPWTLSVLRNGELMMVDNASCSLMIYRSDAELTRSISLPGNIKTPHHAAETSNGNIVIIHIEYEEEDKKVANEVSDDLIKAESLEVKKRKHQSNLQETVVQLAISELTRDGQMVIRRCFPSEETYHLYYHNYHFTLDSDDHVFVADYWNARVILLDSDLKRNRVICSRDEESEEERDPHSISPQHLCYDEDMKQLIVVNPEVDVYNLSRD